MDQHNTIEDLQIQVVNYRTEVPKMYSIIIKKKYKEYVESLRSIRCHVPENLTDVTIKESECFSEIPLYDQPSNITNILQNTSNVLECMKMIPRE